MMILIKEVILLWVLMVKDLFILMVSKLDYTMIQEELWNYPNSKPEIGINAYKMPLKSIDKNSAKDFTDHTNLVLKNVPNYIIIVSNAVMMSSPIEKKY